MDNELRLMAVNKNRREGKKEDRGALTVCQDYLSGHIILIQSWFEFSSVLFVVCLLKWPTNLKSPFEHCWQMIVTDIYNHRFHRIFATNENLSSIMERDDIYM